MTTVTVSPKYQVVIPEEVRKSLKLRPGEKVRVFLYENRIEYVPIRPLARLRGSLKGIDTSVDREADRV